MQRTEENLHYRYTMTSVPQIPLNDGRAIPQFGLGVWQVSETDIRATIEAAIEAGYRHFDTAALYKNEAGVGQALRESGLRRDEYWVTTKLWNNQHEEADVALQQSLDRLGMGYVDLYLIHWPSPQRGKPLVAWDTLIQLRDQGVAKSIGVSNFSVDYLTRLLEHSDVVPAVSQIELHPTLAQTELRALHDQHGIKTEAWSPLGQSKELEHPTIIDIAQRNGCTPAQVILAWHLAAGIIVFPKSSNPERIAQNFAALDVTLPDADLALIDKLDTGNRVGPDPDVADF